MVATSLVQHNKILSMYVLSNKKQCNFSYHHSKIQINVIQIEEANNIHNI